MKHANILKKELGLQLGILRLKQGKKLSRVATDLGWKDQKSSTRLKTGIITLGNAITNSSNIITAS